MNPITNNRIDKWELSVRKFAHYLLFALGGFVIYLILAWYSKRKHKILLAIFYGTMLAIFDEFHQLYSSNRGPQLFDVGIDTAGVISGVIVAVIINQLIEKISKGEKIYDKFQKNNSGKDSKDS